MKAPTTPRPTRKLANCSNSSSRFPNPSANNTAGKRPQLSPSLSRGKSMSSVSSSHGDESKQQPRPDLFKAAIGMFLCYVCHDALQEKMFRFEGFEFGWFMTLGEVGIMLIGAALTEDIRLGALWAGRGGTFVINAAIGISVAGSHGLGNTALNYSSFPLKISFKSCKLVPTMAIGVCVTGRHHSMGEYLAALVMCAGLILMSLADYGEVSLSDLWSAATLQDPTSSISSFVPTSSTSRSKLLGPFLLALATSLDSIVPNLQERLFKTTNARTVDIIFVSNIFMFLVSFIICTCIGELGPAMRYCGNNPNTLTVLTLQSVSAYCGLQCYLAFVKAHGGVAGVILANGRKVCTIVLSFLVFAKPCRIPHVVGLGLIFVGVYLGVLAKRAAKRKARKSLKQQESKLLQPPPPPAPASPSPTMKIPMSPNTRRDQLV